MMAEPPQIASSSLEQQEHDSTQPKKKIKIESSSSSIDNPTATKLEDRLGGILCCTVCLDPADNFIYQCVNGHLMCHRCLEHLLADARIRDESSTCPNCRVEISRNQVTRNLAVEKATAELPSICAFCRNKCQRNTIRNHEQLLCAERTVCCQYDKLGCSWKGPFVEQAEHEKICTQPSCEGRQILPYLRRRFESHEREVGTHKELNTFMSCEKLWFTDIQLKPYRTDEFNHRLMYDTSSFSAFGYNWSIKVTVNDNDKDAHLSNERYMAYQLVLKTKPTSTFFVKFFLAKGPYHLNMTEVDTVIYSNEFSEKVMDSLFFRIPVANSETCNHLLSLRVIDFRIFMAISTR